MWEEDMDHFMSCSAYGKRRSFENDSEKQHHIALEIKWRGYIQKSELDKAGMPSKNLAPMLH